MQRFGRWLPGSQRHRLLPSLAIASSRSLPTKRFKHWQRRRRELSMRRGNWSYLALTTLTCTFLAVAFSFQVSTCATRTPPTSLPTASVVSRRQYQREDGSLEVIG